MVQRENRYVTDVNHSITKALVEHYGQKYIICLEDLTNVRQSTERVCINNRYTIVSWAFINLEKC